MFNEEDIVFSYTTKMAVEDGVLISIPGIISGTLGIKFPVYFNDSVWNQYVDSSGKRAQCSDKTVEISRILEAFVPAARKCSSYICHFNIILPAPIFLTNSRNETLNPDGSITASLKAVIAAEDIDKPSPAIFFMLPWED
jgi:hypothetical protein